MLILQQSLPGIKRFLKPAAFRPGVQTFVLRLVAAFLLRRGRMSACQAAASLPVHACHRASVPRFLARAELGHSSPPYLRLAEGLIQAEARRCGRWLLLLDSTLVGQPGQKTENTFSTGNRQKRPRQGRRYSQYQHARRSCHCFVMGLLITPRGYRLPRHRCYYTKEFAPQCGRPYRTQAQLAAELVRHLPVPQAAQVYVVGDTAFDAKVVRQACAQRNFQWITPVNPERVLAGPQPRPQVRSLLQEGSRHPWVPVRLVPGQGRFAAQRRVAAGADRAETETADVLRLSGKALRAVCRHGTGGLFDQGTSCSRPTPGCPEDQAPDD
jgi:hypothetical protein